MISFRREKQKKNKKQRYHNDICRWRDYFSSEIEIKRELIEKDNLNKSIEKDNFKKCITDLIEANHQMNMTSDLSFPINNLLKSHLNAKSFTACF